MSDMIRRAAPTAVVTACVVWCCWPYLSESDVIVNPSDDSNKLCITEAQLSPTLPAAAQRDPFRPVEIEEETAAGDPPPTAGSPDAPPECAEAQVDVRELLRQLKLNATFVRGARRAAMIEDGIYEQGDPLRLSDSVTEPCTVKEISADRVLIQHGTETVELTYPGPAAREPAAPAEDVGDSSAKGSVPDGP